MSTRIWGTFAPLKTAPREGKIVIEGGTFRYVLNEGNGLLDDVRIRGEKWLAKGSPLPDLWVSDAVHPRGKEFRAVAETRARVELVNISEEKVVVSARGRYRNRHGEPFPLEYRLEYTIDADGLLRVEVENLATGKGALRWLTFSRGHLPARRVAFVNHSEDLGQVDAVTGGFTSEPIPSGGGTVLAGQFFPWLQFGNDVGGLDLTVDEADDIAYGFTDSMPYEDGLGNLGTTCEVTRKGDKLSWEYFSIRNLYTPLRRGWTRRNRFYLGVTPAKEYDPALSDIRVNWTGPHQINPDFVYPTDEQVAEMGRQGINLVLGCTHWRSGEYSKPLEPRETERVIRACHRSGIKIIPYITFTDLNHQVPAFTRHGQDWQIEPAAEYRHLTNLMCYGAKGWREYWKQEVNAALERFDFDGLYIDFWVGKMACRNRRHGCGRKYGRYTLPGLREMAMHAFKKVKEKGGFILSNTNMCAGTAINNLVDIRLPGEWENIEHTPEAVARGYLNSRRLGCNSLLLAGCIPRYTLRSVSLSLRCQSSIAAWRGRMPAERKLYMKYADILRSFGIKDSQSLGAWETDGSLTGTPKGMVTYWYRNKRGALIVGVDTAGKAERRRIRVDKPGRLGLRANRRYLLYRPDARKLLSERPVVLAAGYTVSAALRAWEPLLVHVIAARNRPQLLWATASDGVEEKWDAKKQSLHVQIAGAPESETHVSIYAAGRSIAGAAQDGHALRCSRTGESVSVKARCNQTASFQFSETEQEQAEGIPG